jgi:hypothetical protein
MIPVINRFITCGYQVMLGGTGKSGELLKTTFPQLPFVLIPSPVIHYAGKRKWLILSLIMQLPKILLSTVREHYMIKKIVIANKVDIIVSDNRYGLFCRHVHSIFVTHQISPVLPAILRWTEYPLYLIIRAIILQYDECWIPDYADSQYNLSGMLSHRFKLPGNACYVGILSRFDSKYMRKGDSSYERYDLVVVLSGPEPQLGIINEISICQALTITQKTLIISGWRKSPISLKETSYKHLTIVSHLEPDQFSHAVSNAGLVICTSGYSGIMDLVVLKKTAILVPTPGQTEQEYLAGYLSNKGWFSCVTQHDLDLQNLMKNKNTSLLPCGRFSKEGQEDLPIHPVS